MSEQPNRSTQPHVLFVLGGPGAGKGTQCERLVEMYGFVHLSAGDLLRKEQNSGSEHGEMIASMIREGKIVPGDITLGLLRKAIFESEGAWFLIDGFPRSWDNLHRWEDTLRHEVQFEGVLCYECPLDTLEQRLLKRGKTSGREDDNFEAIRKRFVTFQEQTMPVIEHYEKQNKVYRISSIEAPDRVFERTIAVIEPMLYAHLSKECNA